MGRHTIVNPKTGRRVFKTGQLGRKIQKNTYTKKVAKNCVSDKCMTSDCTPIRIKHVGKTNQLRLSAKDCKRAGIMTHLMTKVTMKNGTTYWRWK